MTTDEFSLTAEQNALFREIADQILESLGDWVDFFDDPKFHSIPFFILFIGLFSEPGQKKSDLILRLQTKGHVSHSTAQRMLKEAEEAGYLVVDERVGERGLSTSLSSDLYNFCVRHLSKTTMRSLEHTDSAEQLEI